MSLIKPISFLQKKKVGGVTPPPGPTISSIFLAGSNFYTWKGSRLGVSAVGGIAKIGINGTLDTTWTTNANPSPTNNVRQGSRVGSNSLYVYAGTTNASTRRFRELDVTTGVVLRTQTTTEVPRAVRGLVSIPDYFFICATIGFQIGATLVGRSLTKVNTSNFERDITFYNNIGTKIGATVNDVFITPTKLGVVGDFTSYDGNTALDRFIVLNHDGTYDTGFNRAAGNFNGQVNSVLFADNKWIVNGNFTTYNGVTQQRIIAFNPDGSLNTTFNTNTATLFNNFINKVYKLNDTQLLVIGLFTTLGQVSNRIAIINNDGTIVTNRFGTGFSAAAEFVAIDSVNDVMYMSGNGFTTYNGTSGLASAISLKISDGTINTNFVTGTGMRDSTNTISSTNMIDSV